MKNLMNLLAIVAMVALMGLAVWISANQSKVGSKLTSATATPTIQAKLLASPTVSPALTVKYRPLFVKCEAANKLVVRGWVFNGDAQVRGVEVRISLGPETESLYTVKTGALEAEGYYSIDLASRYLVAPPYIAVFENGQRVSVPTKLKFNYLAEPDPQACQRQTINFQRLSLN